MSTNDLIQRLWQCRVDWELSAESPYLFQAAFENKTVQLRLNDFPDEPLCTIIVDGTETDLHEFPSLWTLPRHRQSKKG